LDHVKHLADVIKHYAAEAMNNPEDVQAKVEDTLEMAINPMRV
jgi:hypothetical protein